MSLIFLLTYTSNFSRLWHKATNTRQGSCLQGHHSRWSRCPCKPPCRFTAGKPALRIAGGSSTPWRTADAVLATAHQSWSDWDVAACRCAAESVPPTAIGSLLTAFAQAHTARSATSGIGLPCRADTRCYSRHKPNARQVIGQRLWLTGTHSSASRHLHSPSSLQDKSCTASKPPCGQLLAEAAAATIWFYVTRKIPFALVKRKGHSHHTADNLRHVSLSLRTNNHAQAHYLPVRAERCSSLRSSRV